VVGSVLFKISRKNCANEEELCSILTLQEALVLHSSLLSQLRMSEKECLGARGEDEDREAFYISLAGVENWKKSVQRKWSNVSIFNRGISFFSRSLLSSVHLSASSFFSFFFSGCC